MERPCALCQSPVTHSDYVAGVAKLVQGTLYCGQCALEVGRARTETLAFRQSLRDGGLYQCADCDSPVPLGDIKGAAVVYLDGNLYCRLCSRNLLRILAARRLRYSQRLRAQEVVRAAAEGEDVCAGCGSSLRGAPALVEHGDSFCSECAQGITAALSESGEGLAQLVRFNCGGCEAVVDAEDLLQGRAVRSRGVVYCRSCQSDFGRSSLERSGHPARPAAHTVMVAASCARCRRTIQPLELREGRARELKGQLHCQGCCEELDRARSRRRRRRAIECSHCGRKITSEELKKKAITYHGGNVYCVRCGRDPAAVLGGAGEAQQAQAGCPRCGGALSPDGVCVACAAALAKVQQASLEASVDLCGLVLSYPCDRCGGSISEEDLSAGRAQVVKDETICQTCAGREARKCQSCQQPLPKGADPQAPCETCRGAQQRERLEVEEWMNLSLSCEEELHCGGCQRVVSHGDLATKKATSVNGTLLCEGCQARRKQPPTAGARKVELCPVCDGPLGRDPFTYSGRRFCRRCQPVFEAVLSEAALGPGEEGSCKKCGKQAAGVGALRLGGHTYCARCRAASDLLLQLEVRSRRARGAARSWRRPALEVGAVVGVGCLLLLVAPSAYRALTRANSASSAPAVTLEQVNPAAREAYRRGALLASVPVTDAAQAAEQLKVLRECAGAAEADTNLSGKLQELVVRAEQQLQAEKATDAALRDYEEAFDRLLRAQEFRQCLALEESRFDEAQRARQRVRQRVDALEAEAHKAAAERLDKAREEFQRELEWEQLDAATSQLDLIRAWALDEAAVDRLAKQVESSRQARERALVELAGASVKRLDSAKTKSALGARLRAWPKVGQLVGQGGVAVIYESAADLQQDLRLWEGPAGAVAVEPLPGRPSERGLRVRAGARAPVILALNLPLTTLLEVSLHFSLSQRPSQQARVALLAGLSKGRASGYGVEWGMIPSKLGPSGLRAFASADRPPLAPMRALEMGFLSPSTGRDTVALKGQFLDREGRLRLVGAPVRVDARQLRGQLGIYVLDAEVWISGLTVRGVIDPGGLVP